MIGFISRLGAFKTPILINKNRLDFLLLPKEIYQTPEVRFKAVRENKSLFKAVQPFRFFGKRKIICYLTALKRLFTPHRPLLVRGVLRRS